MNLMNVNKSYGGSEKYWWRLFKAHIKVIEESRTQVLGKSLYTCQCTHVRIQNLAVHDLDIEYQSESANWLLCNLFQEPWVIYSTGQESRNKESWTVLTLVILSHFQLY